MHIIFFFFFFFQAEDGIRDLTVTGVQTCALPIFLRQQGLEIALTTYGLSDKKKFRQNLRLALDRGLAENDAVAALTTVPAKLCGVEKQLGTIEVGKLAYLTVVEGTNYFNADAKVREVWIDGRIYPAPAEEPKPG